MIIVLERFPQTWVIRVSASKLLPGKLAGVLTGGFKTYVHGKLQSSQGINLTANTWRNVWQLMINYKIKLQCWYESYVHFFHEQITLIKRFNGCWFTILYSLSYLLCNIYRFAIQTEFNRRLAIHIRFDKGVNYWNLPYQWRHSIQDFSCYILLLFLPMLVWVSYNDHTKEHKTSQTSLSGLALSGNSLMLVWRHHLHGL